jgi:hypothetical protein
MLTYPQKITFPKCAGGVRDVLIYSLDLPRRQQSDGWADDVCLDIEDRFVCQVCGRRGADVRPKFFQAKMGTN